MLPADVLLAEGPMMEEFYGEALAPRLLRAIRKSVRNPPPKKNSMLSAIPSGQAIQGWRGQQDDKKLA